MSFRNENSTGTKFAKLGEPLLTSKLPGTELGCAYLQVRGWSKKAIRACNMRFIDGDTVERIWPSTAEHNPVGAIVLVYPDDPEYAVVRVLYPADAPDDVPKFLTPPGLGLRPYISASSRKALSNPKRWLLIVESPFKAALAACKGIPCIGVNGCCGCKVKGEKLPDNPTEAQARAWFRPELLEYLRSGRTVMFITDADDATNLNVRKAQLDTMDAGAALGCIPLYRPIPDGGDGKTGLDDFLVDHTVKEFKALRTHRRNSRHVEILRNPFRDLTEVGMADRFIAIYGRDVRHHPESGQWYAWNGQRWQPGATSPYECMRATVESLKAEAAAEKAEDRRKDRDRAAQKFQSDARIKASLEIASRDEEIRIHSAAFDAESQYLGVQNGTLDLETGKLLPAARMQMVTTAAACEFDPKAKAPLFNKFIARATGGDGELVGFAQEVYGAMLLGRPDRSELIFFYGEGNTGKSVAIEVAHDMLGEYATATKAALILRGNRNADPERSSPYLKSLRGRRLVTCSELPENIPLDEALVKDLTGGDMITARGHYEGPVTFRNTARLVIRCNHLPVVAGTDAAIWNRILIVPFEVVIPESERDKELRSKIAASELPGVLNWALEGLRRYAARGYRFQVPKRVTALIDKHRQESDVLGLWLEEHWDVKQTETEIPYRTRQKVVTANYRQWCTDHGHQPLSGRNLWQKLRERFKYDPIARLDHGEKWALGFRQQVGPAGPDTLLERQYETVDQQREKISQLLHENERLKLAVEGRTPKASVSSIDEVRARRRREGQR